MPEVVKVDVSDTGLLQRGPDELRAVVRVYGRADRGREDISLVRPPIAKRSPFGLLALAVLPQFGSHHSGQRDCPS